MLTWNQSLKIVMLLAIAGFALVVVSSIWKILTLAGLATALVLWLGRKRR